MPRNPVIFLDKTYKTQGEFEAFVKNLIYNEIGVCDDIENIHPSHYNTLIEILTESIVSGKAESKFEVNFIASS